MEISSQNTDEKKKLQVAVVAPTTLLANQHYKTFKKRFENTDTKIACLSRLNTPKQSREIKKQLENGEIDIVIGTHALLSNDVKFHNLGLLIIDEEQRFGVKQKEKLKSMRLNTHVLAMSATPIPRTLQMSMTGIRDLSILSTPPANRICVKTVVSEYDDLLIKDAIEHEIKRGGQVFFVVPRIEDIKEVQARLEKFLPDIKSVVIHGQMDPKKSEELMNDFQDGKYSILISTTIIENGIDIANANTMIVYKANNFGLAQLYQLKGRVGRRNIQAYCYLTYKHNDKLSDTAKKRLEIMKSIEGLNAGFKIASEDMELRGVGNIVGIEQSGHIKDVGIELYNQLLKEAVEDANIMKNNKDTFYSPEIKLGLSTIIPSDYISDKVLKMSFYRRIADIETLQDKQEIEEELIRRFGKINESVNNLIQIALLKRECKKFNICKLEKVANNLLISFHNNEFNKPEELFQFIMKNPNVFKIQKNTILSYVIKKDVFTTIYDIFKILMEL